MTNVSEGFNLQQMGEDLRDMYQAKGYTVHLAKMKNGLRIRIEKGCGGANMLLGLGEGITATCMLQNNDSLIVNYSEGDWTGKIIGLTVGWFVCLIPAITSVVGCIKQSSFSNKISQEIMMLVND